MSNYMVGVTFGLVLVAISLVHIDYYAIAFAAIAGSWIYPVIGAENMAGIWLGVWLYSGNNKS